MTIPPYGSYRASKLEWLGEVPSHWTDCRLRHVLQLNPSKAETAHRPRGEEVSFVPMDAIGEDGSLRLDQTRPIGDVDSGYTYFRDGDVVLAKITPCFENGKGAIMRGLVGGVGFGTTELIVARPKTGVSNSFIYWLFNSTAFRRFAEGAMYGAGGQKRVPDEFVRNFPVSLPPRLEQVSIASFLDRETAKIDALVEAQQGLIELLNEKRQAIISQVVTKGLDPTVPMKNSSIEWLGHVPAHWKILRLKYVVSILSGYAFPSQNFAEESEQSVRLLRGVNVAPGFIRWDDTVYWDISDSDKLSGFSLNTGDVIIGMDRPWISGGLRIASVSESDVPSLLLQRVAALRGSGEIDPPLISYNLSTDSFYHYCAPDMTGVSVPHISPEQISSFHIALPSPREQREIINKMNELRNKYDALVVASESAIKLLQERRAALISAAVTGKIDVREASSRNAEAA